MLKPVKDTYTPTRREILESNGAKSLSSHLSAASLMYFLCSERYSRQDGLGYNSSSFGDLEMRGKVNLIVCEAGRQVILRTYLTKTSGMNCRVSGGKKPSSTILILSFARGTAVLSRTSKCCCATVKEVGRSLSLQSHR